MKYKKIHVLCLCQGGNVRSVALAYLLKQKYGIDAIAASLKYNTDTTISTLIQWSDRVIVVADDLMDEFRTRFPEHIRKAGVYPIGPDVWGNPIRKSLLHLCEMAIQNDPEWPKA